MIPTNFKLPEFSTILGIYLVLINITAFLVYAYDKRKAKKNIWRTPEKVLIILALVGGSVGAIAAMKVFHHKTKHPKFYIGVPAILIMEVSLAMVVYLKL